MLNDINRFEELTDNELDACYSDLCLKEPIVFDSKKRWVDLKGDTLPKYCKAFGREFILNEIMKKV